MSVGLAGSAYLCLFEKERDGAGCRSKKMKKKGKGERETIGGKERIKRFLTGGRNRASSPREGKRERPVARTGSKEKEGRGTGRTNVVLQDERFCRILS